MKIIDVRGLSCPQPVLDTMNVIRSTEDKEIKVISDSVCSVENVERAVSKNGWTVREKTVENGETTMTIVKKL